MAAKMINDHDLKKQINDALALPLEPREWEHLLSQGEIRSLKTGRLAPEGVAAIVEQRREIYGRAPAGLMLSTRERGGESSTARSKAISLLVAAEAGGRDEIIEFRKVLRHGIILSRDEVEPWIQNQAKADGPPTVYLTVAAPPHLELKVTDRGGIAGTRPFQISDDWPANRCSRAMLDYLVAGNNYVRRVAVCRGGVLDRLRMISEDLAADYGWWPAAGTVFVLTGTPPLIDTTTVQPVLKRIPALSRIALTIDPALSPREVSSIYRRLRKELVGIRYRSLSEKHGTLVVFVMSRPKKETYARQMEAWNKKYPKWEYKHTTNFGRDVQIAKQRLLNPGQLSLSNMTK